MCVYIYTQTERSYECVCFTWAEVTDGEGAIMEPIWKLLRSTAATVTWNSDFRAALKSALSGRQWTQQRCWAAGWEMKHSKCLFCVHQCLIQEPLVPPSVRGQRKKRECSGVRNCDQCVSRVVQGFQGMQSGGVETTQLSTRNTSTCGSGGAFLERTKMDMSPACTGQGPVR